MVIKASSAAEIRALVDALGTDDDVQREAAIARLGIIGERAVERLCAAYAKTADRRTHRSILRALESIGDRRSLPLARTALVEGGDVAVAAAGVLRTLLSSPHAATAAAALDALVGTTLDAAHDRPLRLAAFDALEDMPPEVRQRVAAALDGDPAIGLDDVARNADGDAARAEAVWRDAAEGRLPETAGHLRDALTRRGASAPLNTLRALVDAVRAQERTTDGSTRQEWLAVRGALHQALALRGSRVALYDLRETMQAETARLPASFLAALHVLGDASCLEPIAAAWGAAVRDTSRDGARWRHQLSAAFRAIAQREKITKRHALMKRIAARFPDL
jgi:hypothetical protein